MMVNNNPNPNPNPKAPVPDQNEEIDLEMRPGGMLVQRREDDDEAAVAAGVGASASWPMIKIDVILGPANGPRYELFLPAHSTFGDMKKHVAQKTNLEPEVQRLFFRGMEKADEEHLDIAGVKNNSKVLLLEARKESKVEEVNQSNEMPVGAGEVGANSKEMPSSGGDVGGKSNVMSKASQAIAEVRAEVDKLEERVAALEVAVAGRNEVSDEEFVVPTELLMRQLLKLDVIQAEGEEKMQRKAEVRRVQNFVDALDALKARNSNPVNNSSNAVTVTTEWETFDSGVGSLNPPTSTPEPSSTEPNQELDGIQAEGEEKMQRKAEVRRVQNFVDALDALKARNSNPVNNSSNAVTVTTEWETFDSGVGSLNPPTSTPEPSSTEPNQEWERFD